MDAYYGNNHAIKTVACVFSFWVLSSDFSWVHCNNDQESKGWFSLDMFRSFMKFSYFRTLYKFHQNQLTNKPGNQDAGASGPLPITHLKGGRPLDLVEKLWG